MANKRIGSKERKEIAESRVMHSQQLINAAYTLKRDEKRILYMFLADPEVHAALGVKVNMNEGVIDFPLSAYSTLFHVQPHEASRDVKAAVDGFEREIKFRIEEESTKKEKAWDSYFWLSKKSYRPKRGRYAVYFNSRILPFLLDMKSQIGPRFKELEQLQNPLHGRLYTKLIESDSEKECELEIEWMIERFELPNSYTRYSNFKQKFLNPCCEKIRNLHQMSDLEFEELKTDPQKPRAVTAVKFTW